MDSQGGPLILVGGENLIDFIQTAGGPDELPCYRANPGGSPYNAAKALARQLKDVAGAATGYLTPISNDTLGELLAQGLTSIGVRLLAPRTPLPTSLAVVSLQGGIPSYQFYREQTAERAVTSDSLLATTPSNASAVFLGSLAISHGADADVWAEYFSAQKKAGLFTMLDPNIRARLIYDRDSYMARLNGVLAHTDLLKLSDEDLQWLVPGESDLRKAARELLQMSSAGLMVVTMGPDGAFALLQNGEREVSVKAAPVRGLKDTVGAGDTFGATLLCSLASASKLSRAALAGLAPEEVEALLRRGTCAAALNCEREGCNPPTAAEIDAALAAAS